MDGWEKDGAQRFCVLKTKVAISITTLSASSFLQPSIQFSSPPLPSLLLFLLPSLPHSPSSSSSPTASSASHTHTLVYVAQHQSCSTLSFCVCQRTFENIYICIGRKG